MGQPGYMRDVPTRKPPSAFGNFEILDTDEFIARITEHIPDKSFQLVRYYGWYSNRSRGTRRKKQLLKDGADVPVTDAAEIIPITEPTQKKIPSKTWRE
jgi:hypothetical protein